MDAQATETAITLLEKIAGMERLSKAYQPITSPVPSTVGVVILKSAAYHLRVQLQKYLTRGE